MDNTYEAWDKLAINMIVNFNVLKDQDKGPLTAYIIHKYAKDRGIHVPNPFNDDEVDDFINSREEGTFYDVVKNHQSDFFMYALKNFGLGITFRFIDGYKKAFISIEKIPNEITHKFENLLDTTKGNPSRDQLREVMEKWNKLKAKGEKEYSENPTMKGSSNLDT